MVKEQIKIRMFGEHLCYLNYDVVREFQSEYSVVNLNSWIKEESYKDFGILLTNKDDLDELKEKLQEYYYENIADWLREKIRNYLLSKKKNGS